VHALPTFHDPPGDYRMPRLIEMLFAPDEAAASDNEEVDEKDAVEDEPGEAAAAQQAERTLHPQRAKDRYRVKKSAAAAAEATPADEAAQAPRSKRGRLPPGLVFSERSGKWKNVSGHGRFSLKKRASREQRLLATPNGRSWAAWQAKRREQERIDRSLGWTPNRLKES
jgi:hypothetical protein